MTDVNIPSDLWEESRFILFMQSDEHNFLRDEIDEIVEEFRRRIGIYYGILPLSKKDDIKTKDNIISSIEELETTMGNSPDTDRCIGCRKKGVSGVCQRCAELLGEKI